MKRITRELLKACFMWILVDPFCVFPVCGSCLSAWTLKSAEAYCSGNQAIAEGKFNGGLLLNRSTSIALSCSPTGVLS